MDRWTRSIAECRDLSNYPENGQHQIWQNHVYSRKDFSTFIEKLWKLLIVRGKWGYLWSEFRTVLSNSQPIVQKWSLKSGSWSRTEMPFWANDMDRIALDNLHKHLEGDESSGNAQNVDRNPQICCCSQWACLRAPKNPAHKRNNKPSFDRIYICGDKNQFMHKITKILLTKPFVHVGLHRNITIQININKTNISYGLISVMLESDVLDS